MFLTLLCNAGGNNSHPGRQFLRQQRPVTEAPAVRHKRAVANRMERAALAGVGIDPRPHTKVRPLKKLKDMAV